jgi:Tol biopolymer transport system component
MSRNDLNDWGRRLDSGERDDALHALAARLAVNRSPAPHPSSGFKSELRARLWEQSIARRPMQWATSLAVASLLVVIAGILWWTTRGPSSSSPATLQDLSTPVPTPLADLPSPTPAPTESVDRLVFHHSSQALFGPNANSSGEWRAYQNVFAANLDGTNLIALKDGPEEVNELVGFSPDGRKVLIFAHPQWIPPEGQHTIPESDEYGDLYVMNTDGSDVIKLTDGVRYHYNPTNYNPTAYWLPDNNRVVFIATDGDGLGIFVITADGSGRVRLTEPGASPLWLLPSSNPDRIYWQAGTIVGDNYTFGGYWWTAMDDSGTQPVWEDLGSVNVLLSPTGDRIAYKRGDCWVGVEPMCTSLFVVGVDGVNEIQKDWEGTPQSFYWSPDGTYLLVDVFVKTDAGDGQLFYLWSPSDSSAVQLPAGIEVWSSDSWPVGPPPQWSPDGRRILFENFTWPLPKILNLDTLEVTEALTALKPKPGITGPWFVTWLPLEK